MHFQVLSFPREGWGIITLFDVFPHLEETFLPTHHSANENSIICRDERLPDLFINKGKRFLTPIQEKNIFFALPKILPSG
jgi:hypothetical protein